MSDFLQVLNTESVQKLKRLVLARPEITEESLETLSVVHSLSFVQSTYTVDTLVELSLPQGIYQDLNKDSENCLLMLDALPNLTPANATDERLWVTLSFGHFSHYVRERWQFRNSNEDKLSKHILTHWFSSGIRGRMRDNGVSRLWWMGHIARKVPGMSTQQVHEILYANSDYRQSLLERNNSSNSLNVLTVILKLSQKAFDAGVSYNRQSFRDFMMDVNFLGGRRNLAAMSEESLLALFTPVYEKAYAKKD